MNEIIQMPFPANQYYQDIHDKSQVYLHHTASGDGADGDINTWKGDKVRVATCVVIDRDGTIRQVFSSKYWAFHLGLKQDMFTKFNVPYRQIDKFSIGIEIDSWGFLTKRGEAYYSWAGTRVPEERVQKFNTPFRGQQFFERYTDEQISAVKKLLLLWKDKYNIPLDYKSDMWDVSKDALSGKKGVYTHCSVRQDKIDCYPSERMIAMLKSLT